MGLERQTKVIWNRSKKENVLATKLLRGIEEVLRLEKTPSITREIQIYALLNWLLAGLDKGKVVSLA